MDDTFANDTALTEDDVTVEEDEDSRAVVAIVNLLTHRLDDEGLLNSGDRESMAYRLAEIMMCAKDLYTKRLQCLTASHEERAQLGMLGEDTPDVKNYKSATKGDTNTETSADEIANGPKEISVFEDLAYTRMHLIRMRDLITDFDVSFMEAMAAQRDEDGNEETWLKDAEWSEEELNDVAPEALGTDEDTDAWARSEE